MATLHVRNVPDALYETLRARAEKEGRSIGGQTVALLEEALGAKEREARAVRRRFRRLPRPDLTPGERLGPGARRVLAAAQQEARHLHYTSVGPEHLLLGLLREPEGPVRRVLSMQGLELETVRARLPSFEAEEATAGPYPFTARTKKVLELALREALESGEDLMEPQHILVALAREGEGAAAQLLSERGVDMTLLRGMTAYASAHLAHSFHVGPPPVGGDWEYHVAPLEGTPEDWTSRLNDLAAEGWQLESVQPDRAVLRRQRR